MMEGLVKVRCLLGCSCLATFWSVLGINECFEDSHLCEQNCTNTYSSYFCSCDTGYTLAINGFSCTSKGVLT